MYFRAFESHYSPFSRALTYSIEYQTSQVIAYGDRDHLRNRVEEGTLIESLFDFVDGFLGVVPRDLSVRAREYFTVNESSLYAVAREVLQGQDDETLLNSIVEPSSEEGRNIRSGVVQLGEEHLR